MLIAEITLDASCASSGDLADLLREGQIIHAAGIINGKWQDFSAQTLASEMGIEVVWEMSYDDTPGTLFLVVWYSRREPLLFHEQISEIEGIVDYTTARSD